MSHPTTTRAPLILRPPAAADGPAMHALAVEVGLDENSPYAYLLWAEYFAATTLVAATDSAGTGEIVGFVTAFEPPDDAGTVFVWQIGVAAEARGQGLAGRLLDALVDRCGARHLEATVTPDNEASARTFTSFARRHDAAVDRHELFDATLFPPGHGAEIRYRIGPLC